MSKERKLKDKVLEQSYSIEALEDDVEHWQEVAAEAKAKLWEIICENDRLTLTYEPYRPPGDEYEGLGFYELIEENDNLTQNILDKIAVINELDKEIRVLKTASTQKAPEIPVTPKKVGFFGHDRWWNASFELWPGAWGLNYYRYDWKRGTSKAREGNFQLGPLGFSWNKEPKR